MNKLKFKVNDENNRKWISNYENQKSIIIMGFSFSFQVDFNMISGPENINFYYQSPWKSTYLIYILQSIF